MSTANIDDVAQTLAEYERLATGTGATVQILPTLFSADLETWRPVWDADEPPAYAHARVYRDDVLTERYVVWAESLPAEESWRALWIAKPTKLVGAYADRSVLRRAFRDAIGDRREPDEQHSMPAPSALAAAEPEGAVHWFARVDGATTIEELNAVRAEARLARAVTLPLKQRMDARRDELSGDAWTTPAAHEQAPATPKRREPQDYRPSENRATRRKAARKKGGRR